MFKLPNLQGTAPKTDVQKSVAPVKATVAAAPAVSKAPVTSPAQSTPPVQQVQIGKYKVEVIRSKCISAGSCVAISPKVFELDEEGLAKVISQNGDDDDTKLLAAQSCPTAAIVVTNTETGEQVWPR